MRMKSTFFLTSTEARPTLTPRKCAVIEKMWSREKQENFLRVRIEPLLKGHSIGVDQEEISDLVLAPRYVGEKLDSTNKWPITVFVCSVVNGHVRNTGKISAKDLHILLIGEIYQILSDAEKAISHESLRI